MKKNVIKFFDDLFLFIGSTLFTYRNKKEFYLLVQQISFGVK